jgi:hypothetical protein
MSPYAVIGYFGAGMLWMITEHYTMDVDLDEMTPRERKFAICQQIVHYARGVFVWPFYLVEDFLLWLENREEINND